MTNAEPKCYTFNKFILCGCEPAGERRYIRGIVPEYIYQCGEDSGEEPPVLIPNTEVKLTSAENTLLETTREDRDLPHTKTKRKTHSKRYVFSFSCGKVGVTDNFSTGIFIK